MKHPLLILSALVALGFAPPIHAQGKSTPEANTESLKQQFAVLRQHLKEARKLAGLTEAYDELIIEIPASGPMSLNDEPATNDQIAKILVNCDPKTTVCIIMANPNASCKRLGEAIDLTGKSRLAPAGIIVGTVYIPAEANQGDKKSRHIVLPPQPTPATRL